MSDKLLIEHVTTAIIEADKQFAAPLMILKQEEAEAYAKAAIEAKASWDAALLTHMHLDSLVQGYCLSCAGGQEWGTGKPCRNGCTSSNHKNPPRQGQSTQK